MEKAERRVLQRKNFILSEVLSFHANAQKQYRAMGLLDDAMLVDIMLERTNGRQVARFLEHLCKRPKAKLDDILELVQQLSPCVVEEMRAERRLERRELVVEGYVYREAGAIVHAHFTNAKRFSELDKKELQYMLASRYQTAKEAWSSEIKQLQVLLDKEKQQDEELKNRMRALSEKTTQFVHTCQRKVNPHTHDDHSPWSPLDNPELDSEQVMSEQTRKLMELLQRVVLEVNKLQEERHRCEALLHTQMTYSKLDLAVSRALHLEKEDAKRVRTQLALIKEVSAALETTLETKLVEAEIEIEESERALRLMEQGVKEKDNRIVVLEEREATLEKSLERTEGQLARTRQTCAQLMLTQRVATPGVLRDQTILNSAKDRTRSSKRQENRTGRGKRSRLPDIL